MSFSFASFVYVLCCIMQEHHILLSYNSHNNYVMQLSTFANLHELTYNHHIYTMLDVSDIAIVATVT